MELSSLTHTVFGPGGSVAYQAGVQNLGAGMHCPGAIGNPFFHLRLGQCQYEVGNMDRAANELTRAYALEGAAIYDPKCFEFIKTKINI